MAVTPLDIRVRSLLERFGDYMRNEGDASGWTVRCPIHHPDDEIWAQIGDDGTLHPCDTGCEPGVMLEALEARVIREPGDDDDDPTPVAAAVMKKGWGFETATDFLARVFPPIRWLYLDLVPAESVTVIMAAPNAGKTFLGLDVVCQVAARCAAAGKTVTVVEEEGTGAALQWRLRRAMAAVGMSESNLIRIAWNTGRNLRNAGDLKTLVDDCKGSELILLDSLSALSGGIDENSSEDMADVAEALHVLKTQTGGAVVVLHHMTKAAWKEGETPRLEHMRGHGALPGRADAVIALVPMDSDDNEVNFELHCVKQRDGSKPKARTCSVAMKGEAATLTLAEKDGVWTAQKHDPAEKLMPRVVDAMRAVDGPVSKNFLCNTVIGNGQLIRKSVDLLLAAGRVRQKGPGMFILTGGASGASEVLPGSSEVGASGASPLRGGGSTRKAAALPPAEKREAPNTRRAGMPDEEEP